MKFDNTSVRRQDRLMAQEAAMELLKHGEYGFLALSEGSDPYGIPINFVFSNGRIYFHCAPQGEKLDVIRANNRACFVVVGPTEVQPDKFTTLYGSVMAKGRIEIVENERERVKAIELLIGKYSPDHIDKGLKYAQQSMNRTVILSLAVDCVSGKSKPGI